MLPMRRGQFDHELDDVARGAELAVLPGAGDLPEHVFVEVALRVAVLHRHVIDHVHDLREQRGLRDGEARVLHVVRVGGIVAAERAQEREDVIVHDGEHFRRREMLEARPAEIVAGATARVVALGEDAALHRLFEPRGFALLQRVQIVEPFQEKQVGDLLDDFEGIGNAAGPELIPDAVNLPFCPGDGSRREPLAGFSSAASRRRTMRPAPARASPSFGSLRLA